MSRHRHDAGPVKRRRKRSAPVVMAWGMLVLAGVVAGVFFYQVSGFGADEVSFVEGKQPSRQNAASSTTGGKAGNEAERERFALAGSEVAGFDDESQPYRIAAVSARQDTEKPNLVHLNQVKGKLRRADGRKMDVNAATGMFNTNDKSLRLDGNVQITLEDTFTATMATADVDVPKKALQSEADVMVDLDGGQIFSSGIDVKDNGAYVLFKSRVRALFDDTGPADGNSSQASDAGPQSNTAASAASTTAKGNLQQ